MKKIKTDFDTRFRAGKKCSGLQLMETFFQFNELDDSKERLSNLMNYAVKRNSWIHEDPAVIFEFYQSMRSLIRAGYLIMLKERQWTIDTRPEKISPWVLGPAFGEGIPESSAGVSKKHSGNTASKNLIILCPESFISPWVSMKIYRKGISLCPTSIRLKCWMPHTLYFKEGEKRKWLTPIQDNYFT
ncbi:MAG: hypothetical protein MUW56_02390 [Chryseobacterium sp.]|uniref:hypothetical protein n=1 Tax=Chryseobacterium sp. TaxID=1871047 RepID=UPI0025C60249|nr:hypothetical protein [Chryseobacterium sp.]MCJ7932498.1 hypothetical protein [Chryseobacterium sp.]